MTQLIDSIVAAQTALRKAREELDVLWIDLRHENGPDCGIDLAVFQVVVELNEVREQLECLTAAACTDDPQAIIVANWQEPGYGD